MALLVGLLLKLNFVTMVMSNCNSRYPPLWLHMNMAVVFNLYFWNASIASVAMIQRLNHHANSNIGLLENMQIITIENIPNACHYISILLIYFNHLPSRLSIDIYKHRYLKRYRVGILKMIPYLFNTLWKNLVSIHIHELWKLTLIFGQTDPTVPIAVYTKFFGE